MEDVKSAPVPGRTCKECGGQMMRGGVDDGIYCNECGVVEKETTVSITPDFIDRSKSTRTTGVFVNHARGLQASLPRRASSAMKKNALGCNASRTITLNRVVGRARSICADLKIDKGKTEEVVAYINLIGDAKWESKMGLSLLQSKVEPGAVSPKTEAPPVATEEAVTDDSPVGDAEVDDESGGYVITFSRANTDKVAAAILLIVAQKHKLPLDPYELTREVDADMGKLIKTAQKLAGYLGTDPNFPGVFSAPPSSFVAKIVEELFNFDQRPTASLDDIMGSSKYSAAPIPEVADIAAALSCSDSADLDPELLGSLSGVIPSLPEIPTHHRTSRGRIAAPVVLSSGEDDEDDDFLGGAAPPPPSRSLDGQCPVSLQSLSEWNLAILTGIPPTIAPTPAEPTTSRSSSSSSSQPQPTDSPVVSSPVIVAAQHADDDTIVSTTTASVTETPAVSSTGDKELRDGDLEGDRNGTTPVDKGQYPPMDEKVAELLRKLSDKKNEIAAMATRISDEVENEWTFVGRKPRCVNGAAILLALEFHAKESDKICLKAIAMKIGAAPDTVKKRYNELRSYFTKLANVLGIVPFRVLVADVHKYIPAVLMHVDMCRRKGTKQEGATVWDPKSPCNVKLEKRERGDHRAETEDVLQRIIGVREAEVPKSYKTAERVRERKREKIAQIKAIYDAYKNGAPLPEDVKYDEEFFQIQALLLKGVPEDAIIVNQLRLLADCDDPERFVTVTVMEDDSKDAVVQPFAHFQSQPVVKKAKKRKAEPDQDLKAKVLQAESLESVDDDEVMYMVRDEAERELLAKARDSMRIDVPVETKKKKKAVEALMKRSGGRNFKEVHKKLTASSRIDRIRLGEVLAEQAAQAAMLSAGMLKAARPKRSRGDCVEVDTYGDDDESCMQDDEAGEGSLLEKRTESESGNESEGDCGEGDDIL